MLNTHFIGLTLYEELHDVEGGIAGDIVKMTRKLEREMTMSMSWSHMCTGWCLSVRDNDCQTWLHQTSHGGSSYHGRSDTIIFGCDLVRWYVQSEIKVFIHQTKSQVQSIIPPGRLWRPFWGRARPCHGAPSRGRPWCTLGMTRFTSEQLMDSLFLQSQDQSQTSSQSRSKF